LRVFIAKMIAAKPGGRLEIFGDGYFRTFGS
jgi:hypothetical protein